jgi:hypothetical protein
MATPGIPAQARDPRMTTLHTGAITIAVLSGTCALMALVAGSPLEFGVALALCGVGWIAADFIDWTVERERAARRCAVPAARLNPGYGSCQVVYVGGAGEYFSRPTPRAQTGSAA